METKTKKELTPKQKRFCKEYLLDLNATQATIRAGYSKKTANAQAGRMLLNVSIQEKIQSLKDKRSERTEIKADDVIRELEFMAFSRMDNYLDWGPDGVQLKSSEDLTPEQIACLSEIQESITDKSNNLKFKLCDKLKAIELLGKHLGMFIDRKVVDNFDHNVGGTSVEGINEKEIDERIKADWQTYFAGDNGHKGRF